MKGVLKTEVGYTGGHFDNPTYEDVCSNETGHVEVVNLEFDSEKVSYEELLKVFFDNHNPTTPNMQGLNRGSQYRSAIFYHNEEQKEKAIKYIKELQRLGKYRFPIITEVEPAKTFYKAEEYHQKYHEKHKRGFFGF